MKIIFVGTGSGYTSLKRFHSSFLIKTDDYNLLVEAGDGISKAFLQLEIPFNEIDGILISHLHPDHYSGIPALIVQMSMKERSHPLQLFLNKNDENFIKRFINNSYLFEERLGFNISYNTFETNEELKVSDYILFTAKQNTHLDIYKIYDEENELSFSCNSFMLDVEGKNIFYTGDIGNENDLYLFKNEKIDLMISEAGHIPKDALKSAFEKMNPGKLVITHIGDDDEQNLRSYIENNFTGNLSDKIFIAYDGLVVELQ